MYELMEWNSFAMYNESTTELENIIVESPPAFRDMAERFSCNEKNNLRAANFGLFIIRDNRLPFLPRAPFSEI